MLTEISGDRCFEVLDNDKYIFFILVLHGVDHVSKFYQN